MIETRTASLPVDRPLRFLSNWLLSAGRHRRTVLLLCLLAAPLGAMAVSITPTSYSAQVTASQKVDVNFRISLGRLETSNTATVTEAGKERTLPENTRALTYSSTVPASGTHCERIYADDGVSAVGYDSFGFQRSNAFAPVSLVFTDPIKTAPSSVSLSGLPGATVTFTSEITGGRTPYLASSERGAKTSIEIITGGADVRYVLTYEYQIPATATPGSTLTDGVTIAGTTTDCAGDSAGIGVTINVSSTTAGLTLTVSGSGKVSSAPTGIDCPTACNADFPLGSSVRLTATPDPGFTLTGWNGGCTGTASTCDVVLDQSTTVGAVFTQTTDPTPTLTVNTTTGGRVTSAPTGIDCGSNCQADFANGTQLTLTAAPETGYYFAGWRGACSGTASNCQLTLTADAQAFADFSPVLDLSVEVVGDGQVTSADGQILCPGDCTAQYAGPASTLLEATPASDWNFLGWGGGCTGQDTCALEITENTEVTANFERTLARYQLSSPINKSFESGISTAYGWVCEAQSVSVQVGSSTPVETAYGADSPASESVCGDLNNGFAAAINWADYGDGRQTVKLIADGETLTEVEVSVATFGEIFLRGYSATTVVPDFPAAGLETVLSWSEPHQNFIVGDPGEAAAATSPGARSTANNWESPAADGLESGRTLIRGWACDANRITAEINGETLEVPYGSTRTDTASVCGDTDNGYALSVDWSDYLDGTYQIRLAIDGVEIGTRSFSIATPAGQGPVLGVQSSHEVAGFPNAEDLLMLRWSEPHQNFRIIRYNADALPSEYENQVFTLFIGYFGRPPAPAGLDYYANLMVNSQGDWTIIADDFWNSDESQSLYPPTLSTRDQINLVYNNLFGRDATSAGLDYWEGLITAGVVSLPEIAYTIAYNASETDLAVLTAKRETAALWTESLNTGEELVAFQTTQGLEAARAFLASVDTPQAASQAQVDQAIADMVTQAP